MKRLLILGASGHIGGYLFRQFWEDGCTVFGTSKTPERCSAQQGMLFYSLEEEALQSVLDTAKPEVVISCLRGDFAQQLEAHRFLADYLRERPGTRLVYLSTANVFDALNETPHIKTDPPQAQSEYGCFKIACEQMLTERLGEQLLILRLPIVWGKNCPRLQILKGEISRGEKVVLYRDISLNFTTDQQIGQWLRFLLEEKVSGIVHVGTKNVCSYANFYRALIDRLGLEGAQFDIRTEPQPEYLAVLPHRSEIPQQLQMKVEEILEEVVLMNR